MTDDQLLRAAARIRHLVIGHAKDNCVHMHYIFRAFTAKAGDELEAAIKAILREELKPPVCTSYEPIEFMPDSFNYEVYRAVQEFTDDDPTKSFVLTTEG